MRTLLVGCPKCGKIQSIGGLFGRKAIACECGRRFAVDRKGLSASKCARCGRELLVDDAVKERAECPGCGAPLSAGRPTVIRSASDGSLLAWKYPASDIVSGSALEVHEGQQAVFFRNSRLEACYGPGTHTLVTDIVPALGGLDAPHPFSAEVYFINTLVFRDIRWGTASKLTLLDPQFNINVEVGASGTLSLQVVDPERLVTRLVGARETLSVEDLFGRDQRAGSYRAMVVAKVKSYLAAFVRKNGIGVIALDGYIEPLSGALRDYINKDRELQAYGLALTDFRLMTIRLPDREENPEFWQFREAARAAVCPRCGRPVPEGSRFCNHCGESIGGGEGETERGEDVSTTV